MSGLLGLLVWKLKSTGCAGHLFRLIAGEKKPPGNGGFFNSNSGITYGVDYMHIASTSANNLTGFPTRRSPFESVSRVVERVLLAMDEPALITPGSREFHQSEAMRAAENIAYQYTREAKRKARRECLGHLIESLAPEDVSKSKAVPQ